MHQNVHSYDAYTRNNKSTIQIKYIYFIRVFSLPYIENNSYTDPHFVIVKFSLEMLLIVLENALKQRTKFLYMYFTKSILFACVSLNYIGQGYNAFSGIFLPITDWTIRKNLICGLYVYVFCIHIFVSTSSLDSSIYSG